MIIVRLASAAMLAATLALIALAPPAHAASTEAHISYAAVDAWDPVVLLDIGTRHVTVTRGEDTSDDGRFLGANLGTPGADLYSNAFAAFGGLHVGAATSFHTGGPATVLRSANFNAYAGWTDSLTAHFQPTGVQGGYAFVNLIVQGSSTYTDVGQVGTGGLAFARTYAGISVTGTDADDSIRTTIAALDNINYVTRHLVDDPACDADHFDPDRQQCFTEDPPVTRGARKIFEGGSDYFPDPTQVSGSDFTALNRSFRVRVPFSSGPTNLDVRIKCETYAGAEPGDGATALCDLYNSVYWGGIDHFTDLDGNLLDGVTVDSESGFDYAHSFFEQPGAVPEPATWALLIAGFTATGAAFRRRRAVPA